MEPWPCKTRKFILSSASRSQSNIAGADPGVGISHWDPWDPVEGGELRGRAIEVLSEQTLREDGYNLGIKCRGQEQKGKYWCERYYTGICNGMCWLVDYEVCSDIVILRFGFTSQRQHFLSISITTTLILTYTVAIACRPASQCPFLPTPHQSFLFPTDRDHLKIQISSWYSLT